MIGVDTNILLRWVVADTGSKKEQDKAAELLDGKEIYINLAVLIELVWLLLRTYKFPTSQVSAFLSALMGDKLVTMQNAKEIRDALADWQKLGGDFSDHLIAHLNRTAGCRHTVTFDTKASRSPQFKLAL